MLNYLQLQALTQIDPFAAGRESEHPDYTGKLVSIYHPEVYEDENTKNEITFEYNLVSFSIKEKNNPLLQHQIIDADSLYMLDDIDPFDLKGEEVKVYRLAGVRGWDIYIVPSEVTYSELSEWLDAT